MRKRIAAGNWKMNTERTTAVALATAVRDGVAGLAPAPDREVVLCPPFVLVPAVGDVLAGSKVALGAQDMHHAPSGAFTGEVSAGQLASVGCTHVIIGHSERRTQFGESDYDICLKVNAAVDKGLVPILCVGETRPERELGETERIVERQLRAALDGIFEFNVSRCVIAYEPIWAIGTGDTATPEQAQEVHAFIRALLAEMYSAEAAGNVSILYGGSVTAANASGLFSQHDIDGGLVGGASLDAASFMTIVASL